MEAPKITQKGKAQQDATGGTSIRSGLVFKAIKIRDHGDLSPLPLRMVLSIFMFRTLIDALRCRMVMLFVVAEEKWAMKIGYLLAFLLEHQSCGVFPRRSTMWESCI